MKKRRIALGLALLGIMLAVGVVLAGSSPNYAINWDVIAKGGNVMASANYAVQSTTGQTAIGFAESSSFRVGSGYWYGMAAVSPPAFGVYLPLVTKNFTP